MTFESSIDVHPSDESQLENLFLNSDFAGLDSESEPQYGIIFDDYGQPHYVNIDPKICLTLSELYLQTCLDYGNNRDIYHEQAKFGVAAFLEFAQMRAEVTNSDTCITRS